MTGVSSTGRRGWVGVDRRWLADPSLSDRALRLMLWLDSHTDEYLRDLNVTTMSAQIGWDRKTVAAKLDELIALKLVSTSQVDHRPSGGTRTLVTLHHDAWSSPVENHGESFPTQPQTGGKDSPSAGGKDSPTSTSSSNGSTAPDAVSSSDAFTVSELVRAAEKIRNDTTNAIPRQQLIDRQKAQRLSEIRPVPPLERAAFALLGEEQSLRVWLAEHPLPTNDPLEDRPASGAEGLRIAREAAKAEQALDVGDDSLISSTT